MKSHVFSTNLQDKTTREYITLYTMYPENILQLVHRHFEIKERNRELEHLKQISYSGSFQAFYLLMECRWALQSCERKRNRFHGTNRGDDTSVKCYSMSCWRFLLIILVRIYSSIYLLVPLGDLQNLEP